MVQMITQLPRKTFLLSFFAKEDTLTPVSLFSVLLFSVVLGLSLRLSVDSFLLDMFPTTPSPHTLHSLSGLSRQCFVRPQPLRRSSGSTNFVLSVFASLKNACRVVFASFCTSLWRVCGKALLSSDWFQLFQLNLCLAL